MAARTKKLVEQGIEKGKDEGKLEGKREAKLETAKNMVRANFDAAVIVQVTGLSYSEVKMLQNPEVIQ